MRCATVGLLLPIWSMAQSQVTPTKTSIQTSAGNCSPNIVSNGSGPVTVRFDGLCDSVDPRVLRNLIQSVQAFAAEFPKTIRYLNELLDKKTDALSDQAKELQEWTEKYRELRNQLNERPSDDLMSRHAADALQVGDLGLAERLLKELLLNEEKQIDLAAQHHFNLGRLYELELDPSQALSHYEKAFNYRRDNPHYGEGYADLLYRQRDFGKAEAIYNEILEIRRELSKTNPLAHRLELAVALNNLGVVYMAAQRTNEASKAYSEALQIRRELARANPRTYLPYLATTLNNIGTVYSVTQRPDDASAAFVEALRIRRELAKENPEAYLLDVAVTLNNLGSLYLSTQRLNEANDAYVEALRIRRELAKANPRAYGSYLATTLNSIGNLYSTTKRLEEAKDAYAEALQIRRELAKANPRAYLPFVAETLNNLGNAHSVTHNLNDAVNAYSEALQIRRDLAKANPQVYMVAVIQTLNNLALMYKSEGHNIESASFCAEAAEARKYLSIDNPTPYSSPLNHVCVN